MPLPRHRVVRARDGALVAFAGFGVWRSVDGGITWRPVGAIRLGRASRSA